MTAEALHPRATQVVDESDAILLVLGARDPAGSLSRLIEEEVRKRKVNGRCRGYVQHKIGTLRTSPTYAPPSDHRHRTGRRTA